MSPHLFVRPLLLTILVAACTFVAAPAAANGPGAPKTEATGTFALTYRHAKLVPHVQGFILHHVDTTLGIAGFAQVQPYADFAQLLAGPTLSHEGFAIGLLGGLENSDKDVPVRGSVFLAYVRPRWDVALTGEYGASGTDNAWYQLLARMGGEVAEHDPSCHIGVLSRRFFGEGVYMDYETVDAILYLAAVEGFEDRARNDGSYEDYIRIETGLTVKL
jgi:hypothetical protein